MSMTNKGIALEHPMFDAERYVVLFIPCYSLLLESRLISEIIDLIRALEHKSPTLKRCLGVFWGQTPNPTVSRSRAKRLRMQIHDGAVCPLQYSKYGLGVVSKLLKLVSSERHLLLECWRLLLPCKTMQPNN